MSVCLLLPTPTHPSNFSQHLLFVTKWLILYYLELYQSYYYYYYLELHQNSSRGGKTVTV